MKEGGGGDVVVSNAEGMKRINESNGKRITFCCDNRV